MAHAPAPRAVLTDFGGVLTTSVIDAFRAFSQEISGDPGFATGLFRDDDEAARLLVEHECGRMAEREFEAGIVARMRHHGVDPGAQGFVRGLQSRLRPDTAMLDAMRGLRARGVPVAIVSNSLGDDCYRGYDLAELADVVVASGEVGVRKPARRMYTIACERLGVAPEDTVMIDDLQQNLDGAARLGIRGLLHSDGAETVRVLDGWFSPAQSRGLRQVTL